MGIISGFAFGVVLAVHGGPLFGDHAGCKPEPEAEKMGCYRMQIQRAVRLATVQENSDASNGDVRQRQGKQHNLPPGPIKVAMGQPLDQTIVQGSYVKAGIQGIP